MDRTTPGDNAPTGAEAMVRMLELQGVRHVFGLCGDTSLPFYDALARLRPGIRHILARDERSAGYMADGYARITGRPGICEGPSGGGASYILPGLVEANESSVPVLAITTDVSRASAGRYPLTELDQQGLFRPLVKSTQLIDRAEGLPRAVRAAFRAMTGGRPGAAHLTLPFDIQKAAVPPEEIWGQPDTSVFPAWRVAPAPAAVEAAAAALAAARQPVAICGGGVVLSGAEAVLGALATALDLAVCTTVSGQGSLADTHPAHVGVVGSNGGVAATRKVVEGADLVLFIGCRAGSVTTERWRVPRPGVRVLHIDIDPGVIGANYPTEVGMVGDARLALEALAGALSGSPRRFGGAVLAAAARTEKSRALAALAGSDAVPIRPERFVAELSAVLPDDAIVTADPGTPCPYLSAYLDQPAPGRRLITNRAHGALGYALSAAIGAHIGAPDRACLAVMGDGSFGFTCGELETVARLGLPLKMVVLANSAFGWIKAGQKSGFGERYFAVDFSPTDHAAVARAYGIPARRVEAPGELAAALRELLDADGPALLDIVCQGLHEAAAPVSEWVA